MVPEIDGSHGTHFFPTSASLKTHKKSDLALLLATRTLVQLLLLSVGFGTLSIQSKSKFYKLMKYNMKVIDQKDHPSRQSVFDSVLKQAHKFLNDPSHIFSPEYELLPSERQYRVSKHETNRFKLAFLPTSKTLLNSQSNSFFCMKYYMYFKSFFNFD